MDQHLVILLFEEIFAASVILLLVLMYILYVKYPYDKVKE